MASSPITREQLEVEARSLPRDERARLVEVLLASLEEEAEIEAAWLLEVQRRDEEMRSGAVEGIPAEEVFRELGQLLGE